MTITQSQFETTLYRKVVERDITAEMLSEHDIPDEYAHLVGVLYVNQRVDLSHFYGSWYKSYGSVFPAEDFFAKGLGILDERTQMVESTIALKPEHKQRLLTSYRSALPMIEPPLYIYDNHSNGKHVANDHVMCGKPLTRHDGDVCLDVFNMLSQQPWKLQATLDGTSKNSASIRTFHEQKRKLLAAYGDQKVWMTWRCDSRGRMYADCWWFNPQGDDDGKASIRLPEPKTLTKRGMFWLWADLGTSLGFDKLSWFQRALKARKAFAKGLTWALETYGPEDVNICAHAWKACEQMMQDKPVDHMVSIDATASGIQIASCITGDTKAMMLCNVLDAGTRMDAYTVVHEQFGATRKIERKAIKQALMTMAYGSTAVPKKVFADEYTSFLQYARKTIGGPMYVNDVLQSLWRWDAVTHEWDMPDGFEVKITSNGTTSIRCSSPAGPVQATFYEARAGEQERGMAANTVHSVDAFILREVVRMCNYDADFLNQVRLALSAPAQYNASYEPCQLGINIIDAWRNTGIVSARFLQVVYDEPEILRFLRPEEIKALKSLTGEIRDNKVQLLTIHDCFRCHPNDADDVMHYYRLALANITRGNFLQHMVNTLARVPYKVVSPSAEVREEIAQQIIKSVYALC